MPVDLLFHKEIKEKSNKVVNLNAVLKKEVEKNAILNVQFQTEWYDKHIQEEVLGFPGGAVVESPSANAGDTGSSPGLGRSHMPRSRSEEHTSELQSHSDLVCRLLLEKKKK